MSETIDLKNLRTWIGRTERASDLITPRLVAGFRATLDLDPSPPLAGEIAPLGLHWCLAPPIVRTSETGPDGHPKRGGFLPPVPLSRRMWAGGELTLHDALRVGDTVERRSRISEVVLKEGRSGQLCFVTLDHEIHTHRGLVLSERQDIVYRQAARPGSQTAQTGVGEKPAWQKEARADAVTLFRYSALSFNGHRIHYDRRYCREEEGYPGLVVHGPLQATYLISFASAIRGGRTPRHFLFRGVSPLFDDEGCRLNAAEGVDGLDLWTSSADGRPTMKARADW